MTFKTGREKSFRSPKFLGWASLDVSEGKKSSVWALTWELSRISLVAGRATKTAKTAPALGRLAGRRTGPTCTQTAQLNETKAIVQTHGKRQEPERRSTGRAGREAEGAPSPTLIHPPSQAHGGAGCAAANLA